MTSLPDLRQSPAAPPPSLPEDTARLARFQRMVRRAVWPPILAMALLTGLLLWQVTSLLRNAALVFETGTILTRANGTLKLLVDAETGQRGYLVGGNRVFLAPYELARRELPDAFVNLANLVREEPAQAERVNKARRRYAVWQAVAEREMSLRNNGSPNAVAYFNRANGKREMDAMRQIFGELIRFEEARRDARLNQARRAGAQALGGGAAVTLLIGALLAASTRFQMRDLSRRYDTVLEEEQDARQYLATTLTSIGDAVLTTDNKGCVTLLNPVAETLTGWTNAEARGKPAAEIFDIVNEYTRALVESPIERVLRDGVVVGLANHTVLRRRDGTETAIDDSGAPIKDRNGKTSGTVLVFRDVTERRRAEEVLAAAAAKNERIAETLQVAMLMTPPENAFPGFSLATLYESAWEEAQIGGDFFDAFAFDGGEVAFVVGDVTGKGLEAAAYTAEVKFALRAFLHEDPDPARAMQKLNHFLARRHERARRAAGDGAATSFVSIALAIIHPETGDGMAVAAGAEPPLLARAATGATEEMPLRGVMVGAYAEAEYDAVAFHLDVDDLIILTTDGVTEARSLQTRRFFGYDGLQASVQAALPRTESMETLAQAIVADAKAFANGPLRDDVCVLVARRTAAA